MKAGYLIAKYRLKSSASVHPGAPLVQFWYLDADLRHFGCKSPRGLMADVRIRPLWSVLREAMRTLRHERDHESSNKIVGIGGPLGPPNADSVSSSIAKRPAAKWARVAHTISSVVSADLERGTCNGKAVRYLQWELRRIGTGLLSSGRSSVSLAPLLFFSLR